MAVFQPITVIQGGGGSDEWARPSDWLPIPAIGDNEQVIYLLIRINQYVITPSAFLIQGAYTVDWGDGVIENVASNVQAQHVYNFSTSSNLTSEGFKQALVKITPQAGQNITLINLLKQHTGYSTNKSTSILDCVISAENVSGANLKIGGNIITLIHADMQRCFIKKIGTLTSTVDLFANCIALQSVPLFDTSSVGITQQMFSNCFSLKYVPLFNTSSCTNMSNMFISCYSLETVPLLNTSIVTKMSKMFNNCFTIKTIPLLDTSSCVEMSDMFSACYSLEIVPLFNTSIVRSMTQMFINCYSLKSVPKLNTSAVLGMTSMFATAHRVAVNEMYGTRISFSMLNCNLGKEAIDLLGTNVADLTGFTAQTVTLTGNYGTATMNTSIWTAKNWTVII